VAVIIIATLLPFGGMPAERIPPAWCLLCGTVWLTDAIANVALFVPFGFAVALQRGGAQRGELRTAAAAALLCSTVVESLQFGGIPPGRSPALADIVTNTVGGLTGALAYLMLVQERSRSARSAGWLAMAWTGLAVSVFTLTARALQPVSASDAPRLGLQKSPFGHVPGHGWYEGITDSAAVNDTIVRRGWSGPIILAARADVLPVSASVWVRSTDPLRGQIPLLFVHQRGDSSAWLQIAKSDNDAELTVMRTAWTWGLTRRSRCSMAPARARCDSRHCWGGVSFNRWSACSRRSAVLPRARGCGCGCFPSGGGGAAVRTPSPWPRG